MSRGRDGYISPVGFAREPRAEVRRWLGRIVLALFIAFLGWMFLNRVISPAEETTPQRFEQEQLPGPL